MPRSLLRETPRITVSTTRIAVYGFPLRWRSENFLTQKLKFLTKFLYAFAKILSATAESPTAKPGTRGRGLYPRGGDEGRKTAEAEDERTNLQHNFPSGKIHSGIRLCYGLKMLICS